MVVPRDGFHPSEGDVPAPNASCLWRYPGAATRTQAHPTSTPKGTCGCKSTQLLAEKRDITSEPQRRQIRVWERTNERKRVDGQRTQMRSLRYVTVAAPLRLSGTGPRDVSRALPAVHGQPTEPPTSLSSRARYSGLGDSDVRSIQRRCERGTAGLPSTTHTPPTTDLSCDQRRPDVLRRPAVRFLVT